MLDSIGGDQEVITPIWTPTAERMADSQVGRFMAWLRADRGLDFSTYPQLWEWSVTDLEAFWLAVWDFFDVQGEGSRDPVLIDKGMPDVSWFPNVRLNLVDQIFRHASDARPAIIFGEEDGSTREIGYGELRRHTAGFAATLRQMGVVPGDRVAAFMPNVPETIVAFLAVASIGAVWSVCATDMGVSAVLDRFRQIAPKVLVACDGYRWAGKVIDCRATVAELVAQLPGEPKLVIRTFGDLPTDGAALPPYTNWIDAIAPEAELRPAPVAFEHPLWVVYSSGTTGTPKGMVHGHGGVLLEELKYIGFHKDVKPGDRVHWYSSTGWVVWNLQVCAMLLGATACIYEGSPTWPDLGVLWRFIGAAKATFFGSGSAFMIGCQKAGIKPREIADLSALRSVTAAGSPLPPETFRWIYEAVGEDIFLCPSSGGTDIVAGFVGGVPIMPVYAGEMQGPCLGTATAAFDEAGRSVVNEVGELVCTRPMPSMPLFFWNDADKHRYRDSYYDMYPGVWRHGDWLRITPRGGAIIYGRSDATVNRQGVRMGTSEFYRVIEALPEVRDSMVVDLQFLGRDPCLLLFVALQPGVEADDALWARMKGALRTNVSPRHVPDEIIVATDIPTTLTGKKMEVPIKKLLLGMAVEEVANRAAMANPESLDWYVDFAAGRS